MRGYKSKLKTPLSMHCKRFLNKVSLYMIETFWCHCHIDPFSRKSSNFYRITNIQNLSQINSLPCKLIRFFEIRHIGISLGFIWLAWKGPMWQRPQIVSIICSATLFKDILQCVKWFEQSKRNKVFTACLKSSIWYKLMIGKWFFKLLLRFCVSMSYIFFFQGTRKTQTS